MADIPRTAGPVLIVDDDAAVCEFVEMALSEQGYAVETAINGDAAVEAAKRTTPALVLMDLGLPGPNGADLVAKLQRACGTRVPCAVMSGGRPGDDVVASVDVVGYLAKPFDVDALFALVERHVCAAQPGVTP